MRYKSSEIISQREDTESKEVKMPRELKLECKLGANRILWNVFSCLNIGYEPADCAPCTAYCTTVEPLR